MPEISVLMPVYNTKEEYLREAIESILDQTFEDFEFIIINDGSSNNAKDVILSYNDPRIKYFEQENHGLIYTLNRGLSLCSGKYIARMDSDDVSLPKRFEKQIKLLNDNPQVGVVGSRIKYIPQNNIIKLKENPKFLDFIKICHLAHPAVMIRKESLDKYNLKYEDCLFAEDYDLWTRMIKYTEFRNIPEVLLNYRIHEESISNSKREKQLQSTHSVQQKMLDFLTDDEEFKKIIYSYAMGNNQNTYGFWEKIFSIKTVKENGKEKYLITFCGLKIRIKKKKPAVYVKLMGGLGNQMFQYAFGKALEIKNNCDVKFDNSWFEEAKTSVINEKDENSQGVVIRNYDLDIFKPNIEFINKKKYKTIYEKDAFTYDEELLLKRENVLYEGYFQNEKYFLNIKNEIKQEFIFPQIPFSDKFNHKWLKKIRTSENPVFIHLRRGDYVNLGWNLSVDYYKLGIEYIKNHIKNPTFFIFGQNCEDYIKNEFQGYDSIEIIGENNSKNNEDWKDIVLMTECKHAIIANSTFSWWAAWLGNANSGLVIAPSPFVNNQDDIICENWIKIKSN